jgi:hypothetical protein
MRVLLLVNEPDDMPSADMNLAELVAFHELMRRAGVLVSVEGLHHSSEAMQVRYAAEGRTVTSGPGDRAGGCLAGFWLIQVNSIEEAVAWARRVPLAAGAIEVRQAAFQLLDASGA